ncbi:MAG: GTPase HflX [Phenylobacterium sp.]
MSSSKLVDRQAPVQTALVIHPVREGRMGARPADARLEEAAGLARALDLEVRERQIIVLRKLTPATLFGKGKVEEIAALVEIEGLDVVIIDDALSPIQQRNLEKACKAKVIDRTGLILEIFARRARTREGRLQVELARLTYERSRLVRTWTHLERQRGGIGMRGPGEMEIETDRRIVRDKVAFLKEKLKKIDQQSVTQRKNRGELIRVSLVGYTNVGKSTLMNLLSKSEVFAEDKLFATLDTTVRKVVFDNVPFLLSDTVGFIRKLPHHLIESFKSTLDEVRESDILIHVVDIAHPQHEDQRNQLSVSSIFVLAAFV